MARKREAYRQWASDPVNREAKRENWRRFKRRHKTQLAEKRKRKYHEQQKHDPQFVANRNLYLKGYYQKNRPKALRWMQEHANKPEVKKRIKAYRGTQSFKERTAARMRQYGAEWRSTAKGSACMLLYGIKQRAKKRGIPFNLRLDDILTPIEAGVCQRTGLPFDLRKARGAGAQPFSPSVDRIDGSKGYVQGNIQIVLWAYNCAKGVGTDDDVLRFCRAVAEKASLIFT